MRIDKFYYEDKPGEELLRGNSHPNFVKLLSSGFYYDSSDVLSPFGNDDGSDQLINLEAWYKNTRKEGTLIKWLHKTINDSGFKYTSEACSKITDEEVLKQFQEVDPDFLNFMDNIIIATAFGQFKITGQLDKELNELALIAMKRQKVLNKSGDEEEEPYVIRLTTMENDLMRIGYDNA